MKRGRNKKLPDCLSQFPSQFQVLPRIESLIARILFASAKCATCRFSYAFHRRLLCAHRNRDDARSAAIKVRSYRVAKLMAYLGGIGSIINLRDYRLNGRSFLDTLRGLEIFPHLHNFPRLNTSLCKRASFWYSNSWKKFA